MIKNEKEFPLCEKCEFSKTDFEYRKTSTQCAGCQLNYALDNLKSEIFNPIQKILLPLVKILNKIMLKTNDLVRRNDDSKKIR